MANKVLGTAKYHATRVGGVTTLTAVGTFPNFNDKADIEELPILIFPPQFGVVSRNPGKFRHPRRSAQTTG